MRVTVDINMDVYGSTPITGFQTFYSVCLKNDEGKWSVVKSFPTLEGAKIEMAKTRAKKSNQKLRDDCFRIVEFTLNFSSI